MSASVPSASARTAPGRARLLALASAPHPGPAATTIKRTKTT